jgi:cation transport regulator ChaB
MPYATNATLPPAVKKLSTRLQSAWRKAFNAAFSQYGEESTAFKVAWSQVNKMREGSIHPSFLRILSLFNTRYGEVKGQEKFDYFLIQNGLDVSKSYNPHVQFNEAFTWAEPYVRFLREDKGAKFFAIRALHAIISMNNNDYTDLDQMDRAAVSMNYRPLNYNHDHSRWIPYPRTRVEYAKAEDMCVELIIRVDNKDEYLQKQLEHDPSIPEKEWINHPSIEGRPMLGGQSEGYHFTALAMLEKGYHLPGDPLSEIAPMIFEGMTGGEVCLLVDGERVCLECTENAPTEGENMNELNKGEINQGGAVCPNCGLIANLDGIKIPSEVDCPNCGTSMTARPEKTVEEVETDISSDEDTTPMIDQPETEVTDTGHQTEIASLNALHAEEKLKWEKERDSLINENRNLRDEKAELQTEVAKSERLNSDKTSLVAEIGEKAIENGKLSDEIKELKGVIGEKTAIHEADERDKEALKRQLQQKDELNEGANSEAAKWKQMYENRTSDINEALEKSTLNATKAVNAIREKSEVQTDNAELREQVAKHTREYSDLAQKRHDDAKKILALEEQIATLEEAVRNTEDGNKEKLVKLQGTLEEAKKFHSWAWKKLKEAGYATLE